MHLQTCIFVPTNKYKRIVCDLEGAALKRISMQIKILWLFFESNIQEKFLLAFTGEWPVHYSHLCAEFERNHLKYVQYSEQMVCGWAVLSKDDIYVCGFG